MKLTPQIKQAIQKMYEVTPEYVHSVGLGYKYIAGQNTGRICVVFSLENKKPADQVAPSELLPKEINIDGIALETDVRQTQMIRYVSCYEDGDAEIAKLQPVQSKVAMPNPMRGGQEIIPFPTGWTAAVGGGFNISVGTLGFFAIDNTDNKIVGVTNSHVAVHDRVVCSDKKDYSYNTSDPIVWPRDGESYVPGALSADGLGTDGRSQYKIVGTSIKRYVPVLMNDTNYSDVALLTVDPSYLDENSYKVWAPTGQDPFTSFLPFATKTEIDSLLETNPRVFSTGRTTGPKGFSDVPSCRLRVIGIGFSGTVGGTEGITAWGDMISYIYEDFSPRPVDGGDSGSALIALIGGVYKIIGLVFAGNDFYGFASRIDIVAKEMNIRAWDGTGLIANKGEVEKLTVSKEDPRTSEASFECQGEVYWQSGFTSEYQPAPCPAPASAVENESLCWQKTAEVYGDEIPDEFGWTALSISRDGNSFAGLALPDGINGRLGYARIYFKNGPTWVLRGQSIGNTSPEEGILGGVCLNANGSVVAIGSTHVGSSGATARGRVRIYQWNDTSSSWIQKGGDIFGETANDWSGNSVSLSDDGNVLAIGAPKNSRTGYTNAGHVRVYAWTGSTWTRRGGDIDGAIGGDKSGHSVSISGDGNILAVGSPFARRSSGVPNQGPGKVRVYAWYGSSPWILISEIQGRNDMDEFGHSVSLSGDGSRLAVGARWNQANKVGVRTTWDDGEPAEGAKGERVGQVSIYNIQGSGVVQVGEDIYGDDYTDDFGSSVSMNNNGSAVAAGAAQAYPERLRRRGYVRTFDWSGHFWVPRGKIQPKDSNDAMLKQASLSGDGRTVAVAGSFPPDGNNWGGAGKVEVHKWDCELPSVTTSQPKETGTGSLWAWGRNEDAALGIGLQNEGIHPNPVLVNPGSWRAVSAGRHDSHAIRFNGTRWAWGRNGRSNMNYGTFGDGTLSNSNYPKQIGTETWNLISNSGIYVHAIRSDRTLWAWGNNEYGRLGIGTTDDNKLSPVQVGQHDDWLSVSGADDDKTGVTGLREVSQGLCTLWSWGIYTARNISEEQNSLPSAISYKVPGRVGSNLLWKSISSGNSKLVIGWDNSLWSWGRVSKDYIFPRYNLLPLDPHEWVKISAGKGGHNLAIKSDGTLWAWGDNAYGQTGLDPDEYVLSYITKPTQVGTHTWKEISAGSRHSLAIRSDDTLWAWGDNSNGQLGDGTTISKSTPVQIGSGKWLTVSAGFTHSLAIMKD